MMGLHHEADGRRYGRVLTFTNGSNAQEPTFRCYDRSSMGNSADPIPVVYSPVSSHSLQEVS
jgi:hypothetical protein